jgi:hypothetical protein
LRWLNDGAAVDEVHDVRRGRSTNFSIGVIQLCCEEITAQRSNMVIYRVVTIGGESEFELGRLTSLSEVTKFVAAIPHMRWKVRIEAAADSAEYSVLPSIGTK